jgi:hypothetical protein
MEGMAGSPGTMGRFAQHGLEFSRTPFGDVAMPVAGPGLVGTRHQARVAGDVLAAAEPLDIGEDRERRQGDYGSDPGDRLQPAHVLA